MSTTRQAQYGESLDVQEATLRRFAAEKGWSIVPDGKVWKSALSGRQVARADFEEILAFVKKHPGLVQYYLFRSIDRNTRAGSPEYNRMKDALAALGVQTVDTYGVIQPSINTMADVGFEYPWSTYCPSEITENVLATTSKQEATTILTRVIGEEVRLTQQGYRTRAPVEGYVNHRIYAGTKKKTIQVEDPAVGRYFVAMFDLRASGLDWPEVVKRVNAMGYRSPVRQRWNKEHTAVIGRTGGLPLTVKRLQGIIANPIYAGVLCEKWTHYLPIKAQYEGLVSIAVWNRANRGRLILREASSGGITLVRNDKSKTGETRNRWNPLFPFKFLHCEDCGKTLCGSLARSKSGKKIAYYHCSRGHAYRGIPKAAFETAVREYVGGLSFAPRVLPELQAVLERKYRERQAEIVRAAKEGEESASRLKAEQAAKLDAFSAAKSDVVRAKLEADIERLEERIWAAGAVVTEGIAISATDIAAFLGWVKELIEHPSEILLNLENPRLQAELFGLAFETMPTYPEMVNRTPKLSWFLRDSGRSELAESVMVHHDSLSWNTLEDLVIRWNRVFEDLSHHGLPEQGRLAA